MLVFVSFLFFATVAARPQEMGMEVFDAEDNCLSKFPSLSRATSPVIIVKHVADFIEGLKQKRAFPENPTDDFKCFIACIGRELNLMSHEGDLHFEGLKNLTVSITGGDVDHDTAHTMVSKCIEVDHDDNCEKAWQYAVCKIDELLPYKFSKGFCPSCTK